MTQSIRQNEREAVAHYPPEEYPDIHSDFPQPLRWFRATRYGRWNEKVFARFTDAIRPLLPPRLR